MKKLLSVCCAIICLTATAQVTTLKAGEKAPVFKLKNVDNRMVSPDDYKDAKGFIIVFTCNGCPYAKAYEQRIIELNNKYASQGFPVIAINPNDPDISTGDTFDNMKAIAKSKNYNFPYLYDEGQTITNAYGARNTPHVFVVSKTATGNIVQYTGAIDNDTENTNSGKTKYVDQVITALLQNQPPPFTVTKAIGCGVKRKA